MDLALNNLQRLICHKTKKKKNNQPNQLLKVFKKYTNVFAAFFSSEITFI